MGLDPNLLYIVGRSSSSERGRAWTIDPSNFGGGFTQIKEFNEGGYTQCMGCVIHDRKLFVARAYNTNDGAVSYFDGSTWTDDITWGSTGKATDIVVFNGDIYVMKRISGTQCEVVKRTGAGTWTNVLTITVNSTDPGGGLQVIEGSGGTKYLIAWPYTGYNASQHRFRYSTDGTTWNDASATGLPGGWQKFSYVHWDETNSVYRLKIVNTDADYTAATIGGAWSAGASTGHIAPGTAWGDVFTDENGDVFCAPNADTDVRKFTNGSWSDKHALGAASQVDISNRASWIKWHEIVYLACTASDGKIVSYVEGTDTWTTEASIGGLQDFTGIAGPGRSPMRVFRHQIMRGTDGEAAITPDHMADPFSPVTKVMGSNVISADLTAPPGGESDGDAYFVATGGTGAWSGKDGHIMETPDAGNTWIDHGLVSTGDAIRLSSSVAGATFTGNDNKIAEKTATGWDFWPTKSGMLCAQVSSTGGGLWDLESFIWDGSSWTSISEILNVASGDNALEITNGEISHLASMGHGQENVEYVAYSDLAQGGNDPAAAGYSGKVVIANGWNTVADGHVLYSDGNTWTQLTSSPLSTGARIFGDPAGVEAACGMTQNAIQTLIAAGSFGTQNDWTYQTNHKGDTVFVSDPDQNGDTYTYERMTAMWNGTAWYPLAKWVDNIDGDGIGVDSISRLKVNVKTNAGIAITNDELHVVAQTSAGAGNEPTLTDQAVTKSYVDAVASGLAWKEPAAVLRILNDSDQNGADPNAGSTGEAWLVNNWLNETDGDIVEWDGNAWVVVVANSGGEPPDGTRVVVHEANAAGSFLGQEENIGTYDATANSWSFDTAADGDAIIIYGDNSEYADSAYTYTGTVWTEFSNILYTAGFGLDLAGNAFSFDFETSAWVDKSSGTTWDTGLGANVDGDKMHIFRNGILQRKVASNPGDGEYTWSAGTATFGTSFGPATEVVYAWGPGV